MNQPHDGGPQGWGQSEPIPYPQEPVPYPQQGYVGPPGPFQQQPFGFAPPVRRNRTAVFLGVGAALLVVATIVTILIATGGKSDRELIEARIYALLEDDSPLGGNPANYCAALRPLVELAQESAPESTRESRNRTPGLDEIERIDIDGRDAVATVRGTVNGRSETVDFEFRKEDGQWLYCPSTLL